MIDYIFIGDQYNTLDRVYQKKSPCVFAEINKDAMVFVDLERGYRFEHPERQFEIWWNERSNRLFEVTLDPT